MGVSREEIERKRGEIKPSDAAFGVLAENWPSLQVFDAMGDQWRILAGFGGAYYQGLDYSALPIIEKRLGVKRRHRARIFNDLRLMAAEARQILNTPP